MARVHGVGAVGAARGDDAERGLPGLEHAHLHRGGLAPQQEPAGQGEVLRRIPRRMARGDVEPVEVVGLVLHLGPGHHLEAEVGEDRFELPGDEGDGMEAAAEGAAAGDGGIEGPGGVPGGRGSARHLEPGKTGRDGLLDGGLEGVEGLPHGRGVGGGAHGREPGPLEALPAGDPAGGDGAEVAGVPGGGDGGEHLAEDAVHVLGGAGRGRARSRSVRRRGGGQRRPPRS